MFYLHIIKFQSPTNWTQALAKRFLKANALNITHYEALSDKFIGRIEFSIKNKQLTVHSLTFFEESSVKRINQKMQQLLSRLDNFVSIRHKKLNGNPGLKVVANPDAAKYSNEKYIASQIRVQYKQKLNASYKFSAPTFAKTVLEFDYSKARFDQAFKEDFNSFREYRHFKEFIQSEKTYHYNIKVQTSEKNGKVQISIWHPFFTFSLSGEPLINVMHLMESFLEMHHTKMSMENKVYSQGPRLTKASSANQVKFVLVNSSAKKSTAKKPATKKAIKKPATKKSSTKKSTVKKATKKSATKKNLTQIAIQKAKRNKQKRSKK